MAQWLLLPAQFVGGGHEDDHAFVHVGFHALGIGFGKKVCAAHAYGRYRGVEAVAFGLEVGALAGDLAHGAAHEFELHARVGAAGVYAVVADDEFGVGAQGEPPLVGEDDEQECVGTGDEAVLFLQGVAGFEGLALAGGADARGLADGETDVGYCGHGCGRSGPGLGCKQQGEPDQQVAKVFGRAWVPPAVDGCRGCGRKFAVCSACLWSKAARSQSRDVMRIVGRRGLVARP